MPTALEKFTEAMNSVSPYWTKAVEVTAQEGEIVIIKCDGFSWKSDTEENKIAEEVKNS